MRVMKVIKISILALFLAACSPQESDEIINLNESLDNDSIKSDTYEDGEPLTDILRPVLTDGKRWDWGLIENGELGDDVVKWYVAGDSVVDGIKVKKLVSKSSKVTENFVFLMNETNGEITQRWVDNEGDYSFLISYITNPATENIDIKFMGGYCHVVSHGTMKLQGKQRRVLKVWSPWRHYSNREYDYWVEGIGPLFSHFLLYERVLPSTPVKALDDYRVINCYDGDELIYDYKEFDEDLYKEIKILSDADKLTEEEYNSRYKGK